MGAQYWCSVLGNQGQYYRGNQELLVVNLVILHLGSGAHYLGTGGGAGNLVVDFKAWTTSGLPHATLLVCLSVPWCTSRVHKSLKSTFKL